uniref:Aminotransferase class I/classII large domain-containing protein n=1 Tax=Fibrocapsa japonica TaxID=94617 RepID=A0A6U1PWD6_9STRA|mmetsp:Transcript_5526/g.8363  ORF Transcript_5526/g.8363 Transcript_5526/m.8363 type:complete len:514 (+) Transcript_5526:124-1665(+)
MLSTILRRARGQLVEPAVRGPLTACAGRVLNASTSALSSDTINQRIIRAEYAVRGAVLNRAMELQKELDAGKKLPFDEIISCNIGNPHELGQQPITFMRQVLSVVLNPDLKETANYPPDVLERAQKYLDSIPGMGAYSNSQGIQAVREEVADFITERDGVPSSPDEIFLTDGASEGVRFIMQLLLREKHEGHEDGLMIPIPQYPLYSALTTLLDGHLVPYYLDEESNWALDVKELQAQLDAAASKGITIRGLAVINPGNPTGQLLDKKNIGEVIEFCASKGMVLLADEVYQENIWQKDGKFWSFKKVAHEMGHVEAGPGKLQLVSYNSISKGFVGECGLRGGYFELHGFPQDLKDQIYKLASIRLCSNTVGQVLMGLQCNPPKPGSPSYSLYEQEREGILDSLRLRATKIASALNELDGVTVSPPDGALYSFPNVDIPAGAVKAAQEQGVAPDAFYALQAVEKTGIVMVPGSGFGQKDGTWHFRTTFLPSEEKIDSVISRMKDFHSEFMKKYA